MFIVAKGRVADVLLPLKNIAANFCIHTFQSHYVVKLIKV